MLKKRPRNNLNKEEGSGLVLALMVLLVLSVLGASLGVVTIGSFQLSVVNHDTNSAYYIAEAGVNMAYEEFKEIVSDNYRAQNKQSDFYREINKEVMKETVGEESFDPDIMKTYSHFVSQFGDEPFAKVSIDIPATTAVGNEREYTIRSVGEINEKKRIIEKKVLVTWKDKPIAEEAFPTMPVGAAIIVKDKIELASGKITGDIYIDSKEEKSFVLNNSGSNLFKGVYSNYLGEKKDIYDEIPNWYSAARKKEIYESTINPMTEKIDWDSIRIYKERLQSKKPKVEEFGKKSKEEQYRNINLNRQENIDLSAHNYYQREDLKISGHYTITVGNKDVVIFTDEMTTGGDTDIKIIGAGSLTFVVKDSVKINKSFKLDGENIRIISSEGAEINIAGNASLTAKIYAPESDVVITGSGKVIGDITGDEIYISGAGELTGNILTDEIKITTSSPVIGNIFANEVNMNGGGTVTGNIVAKEVEIYGGRHFLGSMIAESVYIHGNGSVTYQFIAFDDSRIGEESGEPDISLDDLIAPEPAIESD